MEVIDLRRLRPLEQSASVGRPALVALLAPLAGLYGGAVWLWRRAPARSERIGAPVVSIGSILAGGTGKTPLTMLIAKRLLDSGRQVCIISRGYRRRGKHSPQEVSDGKALLADVEEAGDEPYLMARRLPGVCVVVGKDRAEAARHALGAFGPDVFLLDDGFQARGVTKDVEIVTLDAAALRSRQTMLPIGRLREGWSSLKIQHIIVVLVGPGEAKPDARFLARLPGSQVFYASRGEPGLFDSQGEPVDIERAREAGCLILSGVASPAGFEVTCKLAGIDARVSVRLDDHHWYSEADVARVINTMASYGCTRIVTTEKDSVKLPVRLRDLSWTIRADVGLEDPSAFWAELERRLGECK
jgi:tetraacyldisaccharide 4'-kinase